MRSFLNKTWVKTGLVLMALPTALAEASTNEDLGHEIAVAGLASSLDFSAAAPEGSGVATALTAS